MTRVAPRPAPAAAPSREGPARGLRKTPWEAPPDVASPAPTSAASNTRGRRSSSSTAASVPSSPPGTAMPRGESSRSRSVATTAPGGSGSAPTHTPASRVRTSTRAAAPSAGPARRPRRGAAARAAPGPAPGVVVVIGPPTSALQGPGDGLREVGHPRTPARGDVVVGLEDPALLDGGHGGEGGPLRGGLGGLLAAHRVGEDDQVRRLADDVLRGQLRVAARGLGGGVGD